MQNFYIQAINGAADQKYQAGISRCAYFKRNIHRNEKAGTKKQERKEFEKMIKVVFTGDTLVLLLSGILGALNRYMLNLAR